jgi:hypothetical protein
VRFSPSNCPWEEVQPPVDQVVFPDGKRLIVPAKGPQSAVLGPRFSGSQIVLVFWLSTRYG